ncbi:MAG: hypothetical protein IJW25_00195 [Clostridia bacterium]|nr:hypothetical protein [Clostridia bacterium]
MAEETPSEDVKDNYIPYYLKSTEMKGQLLGNYGFDFASQTARWASVDENTNNGYPIPTNTEGARLYPYIPTDILLTAKQFNVLNNGFVNGIINIAPNENKIIISLSENNTYNLLDLFNATIMPSTLNADSLQVMVQSSNLGVIQPVSATYLSGWEFITKGCGTAVLTITALKNPNASCTVQICVVKGFDSWALYENADAELSVFDYTKPYNISLKLGTSMQMIAKFYNSNSQITASDSGILVLVKDNTIFDVNDISYVNFNYNGDHYYAVYADSASILTFTTLAKISGLECIVLPYVIAEFYDANNNPFTTRIIINEESLKAELEFEVYQGSTDLTTTLAGTENEPNNFEADQEITFDINLTTDSSEEQAMGVAYGLEVFTGTDYEADKNKQSLWVVAVAFETIMQDDGFGNYYMALKPKIYDNVQLDANTTINFNEMFTYNISSPIIWANNKGVTQQLRFMLENEFVKTMTKDYYLRFTFGGMYGGTEVCENCLGTGIIAGSSELCVDCRGTGTIANVSKTVYVKITPQGVTRIDIAHFSDAEAEGNYITNAGELPNNAIIAGEYGLLRITVSPDYAYYDEVQVYSSTAEGDVISFDQRVAYGEYDENDIKQVEYHSYQAGVTVLDNGISLSKVSNKHLVSVDETTGKETYSYSFDGTYYLRTLIANYITTAASFDVTVVVLRNGKELSRQTQTISVEKVSDLSVGFYSYHSAKSSAYIAAQTGGIEQTNAYNQNEFIITTVGEFDSIRLKVSSDEISDLNFVKIEQVGTRYFIKLGAESNNYLGKKFRVTAYGTKNMNGYIRTIPRSMNFTIVNFLVMGLVVDKVSAGVYSQVYTTNKEYDLRIVADFTKISYNEIYKDEILAFFDKLNGVGDLNQIIQPWYYQNESGGFNHIIYVDDKDSTNKFICNDVFYLLYRGNAEVTAENPYANVWKIVPQKYGEDQVIQLLVNYGFEDGKLVYYENKTENADSIVFTQDLTITLNFTQRSSLDHPMPIYTKAEFLGMKENGNYILMNDLDFTYSNDGSSVEWSPITTQIASLDGNGRTVLIRTINTNGESKNFGLFDTIGTNTVIKNLNLKLYNEVAISFNLEDTETFNFGAFAAVNKGIISNCAVIGSSSRTDEKLGVSINFISNANSTNNNLQNIAGFVADNQGNITNSRVEKISISTHWGNLAGFAVNNSGVIAGSYFKGAGTEGANGYGVLRNLSDVPQDEYVSTSGFVGYNETNAKILTSYTGGAFTEVDESGEITLKDSSILYTLRDGAIYADYYISGFVFENAGEVSDCYSSMYISGSNYSSGFVFKNKGTGTIKRAYSTSLLKESSRSQTPFIGTTAMGTSVKNNNENLTENSIQSCFFYNFGCPDEALLAEVASPLSKEQFINQGGDEFAAWQDFAVSRMTNSADGSEYTGVWTFVQQNNEYFNTERFTTNFGPKLVAADVVSKVSGSDVFMTLDTEKTYFDAVVNETVYVYNYAVANNIAESTNLSFAPFIITTSEQLNNLLVNNTPEENSAYNNSWFRLANNIDLNEIKEFSEGVLQTISTVFAGNFDGNGFNITIPDIISETQTGQTGVENIENVGFVSQVITNANSLGAIKSLNLTVDDLSAGLITNVGTLAGKVENGYVSNINVKSQMSNQSMVTGGNNVGGVIGKVSGSSRVINISADISVSSTFGSPTNVDPDQSVKGLMYNADILRLFNNPDAVNSTLGDTESGYYNPDSKLSYAGGIIGVVDIVPFEGARNVDSYALNSSLVSGLKVTGNNSVIGINVGGVVGLIGSSSVVNFAEKEVFANNKLKSTGYAGGLVGENHGYLRYSQLYYTNDIQEIVDNAIIGELPAVANFNLFTGTPVAVGGLIGLNYGLSLEEMQTGYIYSSNNRIRVSSENASFAGGLVGVSLGGNMKALFTSASVRGAQDATVGGAFGYVGTLNNAVVDWNLIQNPFKNVETKLNELDYDNIKNQALTVSYIVAQNNWAATDYYIYDNLDEYNAYIGGIAGYVSNDGAALAVIHKSFIPEGEELDDAPDPIYNSSETNFFVNKIYSNTIAKTAVSANNIPVNVSSNVKTMELNAIGNISTAENEEFDHAKGLVRNYMVSADGKKRMFGNWALYSFSKDENGQFTYDGYGSPEFNRDTVPDTIYITDLGQIRNIMTYELDRNYVLLNDINCEGGTFIIGDSNTNCFSGELDGNGFTIYNFTANTGVDHVAFFGVTKNAYIHDVDFFNMQISSTSINPTSTASFVVGKATDTIMEKVNVVEEFNGNTIKSVLTSSAAYTGGLVGYAVSDEIKNVHTRTIDYNNGSLAGYYPNNLYYLCFVTGDIVVKNITKDFGESVGGLFGEIKGQSSTEVDYTIKVDDIAGIQNTVVVDKSAFVGNIDVSGINALKNSYEINIGGFVGSATKSTILQSYTKADINATQLTGDLYVGGFAGSLVEGVTYKTLNNGDVVVHTKDNKVNSTNEDLISVVNIGGYAGYTSAYTWVATTTTNVVFTSDDKYEKTSTQQGNSTTFHQNIGGFAGSLSFDNTFKTENTYLALENILSLTSVYNYTTMARVDSFAYEIEGGSITNALGKFNFLVYENYYSLSASNRMKEFGVRGASRELTTTVWEGSLLDYQGKADDKGNQEKYFLQNNSSDRAYPVMQFVGLTDLQFADRTDLTNSLFTEYYDVFSGGTSTERGVKNKPILLEKVLPNNNGVSDGQQEYKYYMQNGEVKIDPTTQNNFYGFYNNAGQNIQMDSFDYLYGTPTADHFSYAKNIGIFNSLLDKSSTVEKPYGTVVSGVTMKNVKISFTSYADTDINYGIVACGNVESNSVIYGAQTDGFMEITKNSHIATLSGIANNNEGQIIASTSSIDFAINDTTNTTNFIVGGIVANQNSVLKYGLSDCYFGGSIIVNTNKVVAGGVIGDCSKTLLYARNAYTYGDITNTGTSTTVQAFVGKIGTVAPSSSELYFERGTSSVNSVAGKIVAFYSSEAYTTKPLETNFAKYGWSREQRANYGYPYLSCIQEFKSYDAETSQVYFSGDGSENTPYILKNEGQLVWALTNSSNVYYKLERDMDYNIIKEIYDVKGIDPTSVTFKGKLDGVGKSVVNSSGVLVNSIAANASVTALGFKNVNGTGKTLLANNVLGKVGSAYLNDTNATNYLVDTIASTGVISDSLTEGATLFKTNSGTQQNCYKPSELTTLGLTTYESCLQNDRDMDFFNTWIWLPTNASATNEISAVEGKPQLRSFIETWDEKDMSLYSNNQNFKDATVTVDETTQLTTVAMKVDSVEELIRISQYIARNAGLNTLYELTFNSANDYNFNGMRVNPIGLGRAQNLHFKIIGNNSVFYNLVLDDLNVSNATGLFGRLNSLSDVQDVVFNNVSLKTKIYGGVLTGTNAGIVNNVQVNNSWLLGTGGLGEDKRAVLGGVIGSNLGSVANTSATNLIIDSHAGSVGGLLGENIYNKDNTSAIVLSSTVVNTKINSNVNNQNTSKEDWLEMTKIGGFVGEHSKISDAVPLSESSVYGAYIMGYQEVGGFAGSSTFTTASGATGDGTISNVFVGSRDGLSKTQVVGKTFVYDNENFASSKVGGIVGNNGLNLFGVQFTGDITVTGDNVGGIAGVFDARNQSVEINGSYVRETTNITGANNVGGYVGYSVNGKLGSAGRVNVVENNVTISGVNNVGGLVGQNGIVDESGASISGNYSSIFYNRVGVAAGSGRITISGEENVGGLAGLTHNEIRPDATGLNEVNKVTINATKSYVGGAVGATDANVGHVTKINITDAVINLNGENQTNVGGFMGYAEDSVFAYVVNASNITINSANNVDKLGGLIGYNKGIMGVSEGTADTLNTVNITVGANSVNVGGAIGYNTGEFLNLIGRGLSVSGGYHEIGGVVGYNGGKVGNYISSTGINKVEVTNITFANLNTESYNVGGFVGLNDTNAVVEVSRVLNNRSDGGFTIQGATKLGGFVGYNKGMVGTDNTTYYDTCVADASVIGENYIGGFVGLNEGKIESSYAHEVAANGANITATGDTTNSVSGQIVNAGGFVGYNATGAEINTSFSAVGDVVGVNGNYYHSNVGGFAGYNDGVLTDIYNYYYVDGNDTGSGRATNSVDGYENVGGLIGYNSTNGVLSNSNTTGIYGNHTTVKGQGMVGGVVGFNNGGSVQHYSNYANVTGTMHEPNGLTKNIAYATYYANPTTLSALNTSFSTYAIGGIVGVNYGGLVGYANNYSNVIGGAFVGGVAGINEGVSGKTATLTNVFAYSTTYPKEGVTTETVNVTIVGARFMRGAPADIYIPEYLNLDRTPSLLLNKDGNYVINNLNGTDIDWDSSASSNTTTTKLFTYQANTNKIGAGKLVGVQNNYAQTSYYGQTDNAGASAMVYVQFNTVTDYCAKTALMSGGIIGNSGDSYTGINGTVTLLGGVEP